MFETSSEFMFFPNLQDLLIWRVVTSLELPASHKPQRSLMQPSSHKPPPCKHAASMAEARADLGRMLELFNQVMASGSKRNKEKLPTAIKNAATCLGINQVF